MAPSLVVLLIVAAHEPTTTPSADATRDVLGSEAVVLVDERDPLPEDLDALELAPRATPFELAVAGDVVALDAVVSRTAPSGATTTASR